MNPEIYGYIEEKLFEKGALDVYKTPIIMKKGRPAVKLSVLVNEENIKNIENTIFQETTSIGIRKYKVEKIMLRRKFSRINTKYGVVSIKSSYYDEKEVKVKAEFEDCKELAKKNNVPIKKVYEEVNTVLRSRFHGE